MKKVKEPETEPKEDINTRLGLYESLREKVGLDTDENKLPSKASLYDEALKPIEDQKTKLGELDTTISGIEKSLNNPKTILRERITRSGGIVTESQVQRLVASEKKPLLDYYNELVDNRNALASNITSSEETAIKKAEAEVYRRIKRISKARR